MDSTSKNETNETNSEDWTEKYRPKNLSEVVGNEKAITELKNWSSKWVSGKPSKKAVILAGKPGIGKTTSAIALANDMGWEVLEMNASDQRNRDSIKNFVGRSAVDDTFSESGDFIPYTEGKRTLLILDEADNIFGRKDKGGIHEIKSTIKKTEQPIVLIVNDYYDLTRRSDELKKICKKIEFDPVKEDKIITLLQTICEQEEIDVERGALRSIAERSDGDVRSAVRDLESVALGSKEQVKRDDVDVLGSRNREADIFPTLKKILQNRDPLEARRSVRELDEEPSDLLVWIDENLPREYSDSLELANGYGWISKADIYLGRVRRRQWYRAWAYAKDMMTAGVSSAKDHVHKGWTKYAFPTWIRKMSSSKDVRSRKKNISEKIAPKVHSTTGRVNSDFLPLLRSLTKKEEEIQKMLVEDCDLDPNEVASLLETRVDSDRVQSLFLEEEEDEEIEKKEEEEVEEDEDEEDDEKQSSLLEF